MSTPHLNSLLFSLGYKKDFSKIEKKYWQEVKKNFSSIGKLAKIFYRPEPWDSKLFGLRVGKVEHTLGSNGKEIKSSLSHFLEKDYYDYVVFRIPQYQEQWIQAIEENGGILLDTTVDMALVPNRVEYKQTQDIIIPPPNLYKKVIKLGDSFLAGRFFSEPIFKKGKEVYREWIKNSLSKKAADQTFVYYKKNVVHGLVTVKQSTLGELKLLKIPLVGKSAQSTEKGVAYKLLQRAILYALETDQDGVLITTQGNNIPAQRAYLKAGFKPYASSVTLRWKKES